MNMMPNFGGSAMSDAQFKKLSEIIHRDSGIVLTTAKRGLLIARLNRRLRELDLVDYADYCERLEGPNAAEERRQLLSAVTTNVTAFFREEHHFNALARDVLPGLIRGVKAGAKLRFWSAACSSGEEAYSIAMTVLEACNTSKHDIQVIATDIDPAMIARAKAGIFDADDLRAVSPERLKRHFDRVGNSYVAKPTLRNCLQFGELNLHETWPFKGPFDAVFCRNVVIYFDSRARQKLWQRLAGIIKPGGHLFIGHSERLDGPAAGDFLLEGATQYRRCPDDNRFSPRQSAEKE